MTSSSRARPIPVPTHFSQPFWDGTQAGRLLVPKCNDCSKYRWTPQPACPHCLSESFDWSEVSGRGKIYSFTVVQRSADPIAFPDPYVVAIIKLDEGVAMLSTIVGTSADKIEIEMDVVVSFEKISDEITLYPFKVVS